MHLRYFHCPAWLFFFVFAQLALASTGDPVRFLPPATCAKQVLVSPRSLNSLLLAEGESGFFVISSNQISVPDLANERDQRDQLLRLIDSTYLLRPEREVLLGRLQNETFSTIAQERLQQVSETAAGARLRAAQHKALAFFNLAHFGSLYRRELKTSMSDWVNNNLTDRGWDRARLIRVAKLSRFDVHLLAKVANGGEPETMFGNYLMGKLGPIFERFPPGIQPDSEFVPITSAPEGTSFQQDVLQKLSQRNWDVDTLRFLGLSRSFVALLKEWLIHPEAMQNAKPFQRAQISAVIYRAFHLYPPSTPCGAPRAGESVSTWIARSLSESGFEIPTSVGEDQLWVRLRLGQNRHRLEILQALSGESTEFSPYVRGKLLLLFRGEEP